MFLTKGTLSGRRKNEKERSRRRCWRALHRARGASADHVRQRHHRHRAVLRQALSAIRLAEEFGRYAIRRIGLNARIIAEWRPSWGSRLRHTVPPSGRLAELLPCTPRCEKLRYYRIEGDLAD